VGLLDEVCDAHGGLEAWRTGTAIESDFGRAASLWNYFTTLVWIEVDDLRVSR
jgi:hypothetical protein